MMLTSQICVCVCANTEYKCLTSRSPLINMSQPCVYCLILSQPQIRALQGKVETKSPQCPQYLARMSVR